MEEHAHTTQKQPRQHGNYYYKLGFMAVLSFVSMYVLMYSMVDRFSNMIPNINQFYMAGLMTMPMIIIELTLMHSMYMNKKLNVLLIGISAVLLMAFLMFIRRQTAVSDEQFLKSMIPHHAAAILMVRETELKDPELQKLAIKIIEAQQKEIEFMKAKIKK